MAGNWRERIVYKYRGTIREKAIANAKARIALRGLSPASLEQDELEVIVKEEEDKIRNRIYGSGLAAILLLLGVS